MRTWQDQRRQYVTERASLFVEVQLTYCGEVALRMVEGHRDLFIGRTFWWLGYEFQAIAFIFSKSLLRARCEIRRPSERNAQF